MDKLVDRKDIASEYKWKLEDIYATNELWEKDFKEVSEKCEKLNAYRGKLLDSGDILLEYVELEKELSLKIERMYVYAHMRKDEDAGVSIYNEMLMRVTSLSVTAASYSSFFAPEITGADETKLFEYIENTEGLGLYRHMFEEILRQKQHILSAEEEAIIAKASDALDTGHEVFTMLSNLELKYAGINTENGKIELTDGNYVKFLKDKDVKVRKDAFRAMYKTLKKNKYTIAACFVGNLKKAKFYAETSRYKDAREVYLFSDNVKDEVYDNLIDTVNGNLDILGKYLELRKKVLGCDKLHMYDLYVPIAETTEKKYTFEEAKKIVLEALKPMGEEYVSIAAKGLESGWTDVCENRGKRSGAYSWGCYGCHPFMLLNWQGTINDVFTLIHELGHSMHTYYSNANQPYVYSEYPIFAAEVASTVNENLLMHYFLRQPEADRPYLVNHYLEEFRTTVIRQTMFAEFEREVHKALAERGALVVEEICKMYYKINKKYYGKHVTVDKDISFEWMRIPHFYTPFYVYKYATGFSCATAFAAMILRGEVAPYLEFLKSGGKDYPLNMLKKAGVDLNTPAPVEAAMKEFESYVNELETLV